MYQPAGSPELFWEDGVPLHRARFPNSQDDQLLIPNNSMAITSVRGGGRADDGGDAEVRSQIQEIVFTVGLALDIIFITLIIFYLNCFVNMLSLTLFL